MVGEYIDPVEENFYEQSLPLEGKHLVTQKGGIHLGDVIDVYVDPVARRLSAVLFAKNPLGIGEKHFITVDDIEALGEDVVLVKDKDCAVKFTEATVIPGQSIGTFKGIKVTTLLGKDLGIIDDIQLRPSNFRIGEIIFEDGKRLSVDAAEITMGVDAVLVPEDYTSKVVIKVEPTDGILNRIMTKERELVNTITDRSREVGRWVSKNIYDR